MDFNVLRKIEQGDRAAFDTLVREYYPKLMGYVSILSDTENARDIVQDVFLYIWENRSRLQFRVGFQSYMFRMCHSRMSDSIKKRKNKTAVDLQLAEDLEWLESNSDDIIKAICDKDLLSRVLSIVDELPEKRKEVFRLSILENLSNAEIADLLNMPRRTVEGHLYHSLKYLRTKLKTIEIFALLLTFNFFG